MSTSTLPSRTRSLRKATNPAVSSTISSEVAAGNSASTSSSGMSTINRNSPSKLKQPSNYGVSRIHAQNADTTHSTSTSTTRPKTSSGSSSSSSSLRGPAPRSLTTSRPPLTSDNKRPVTRSGAKTPTATAASDTNPKRPPTRGGSGTTSQAGRRTPSDAHPPKPTPAPNTSLQRKPSTKQPPHHGRSISTSSTSTSTATSSTTTTTATTRPAFTTHTQHYTPAKPRDLAPKPLTSSYLAPPTPSKHPSNIALSAETARLQAELLQLHLLHRDAEDVLQEWRGSAKRKLGERFEGLKERNGELGEEERSVGEAWTGDVVGVWAEVEKGKDLGVGVQFEDKIVYLDEVVTGIWALTEPSSTFPSLSTTTTSSSTTTKSTTALTAAPTPGGGRYTHLTTCFDKWLSSVQRIWDSRSSSSLPASSTSSTSTSTSGPAAAAGGEPQFITPLPSTFHDEALAIERKLRDYRDKLRLASISFPSSSTDTESEEAWRQGAKKTPLYRTITLYMQLVEGMLEELGAMMRIGEGVERKEGAWVRSMVGSLRDGEEEMEGDGREEVKEEEEIGAVWRRIP